VCWILRLYNENQTIIMKEKSVYKSPFPLRTKSTKWKDTKLKIVNFVTRTQRTRKERAFCIMKSERSRKTPAVYRRRRDEKQSRRKQALELGYNNANHVSRDEKSTK
jgi:hypothetical protein